MTTYDPEKKAQSWQLFDAIAQRYDFLNTLLSCGILAYWRRALVRAVPRQSQLKLLDCATGTGAVMFSILTHYTPTIACMIGIDLSREMMKIGAKLAQKKNCEHLLSFQHGSATALPFNDHTFDCVTMAFGIRNVDEPTRCLAELYRVLKPGGTALIMEFSLPQNPLIKRLYLFYFRHLLPTIAGLFSRNKGAYVYLNETVESFPYGNAFTTLMTTAGFRATATPLTFGISTLYCGVK